METACVRVAVARARAGCRRATGAGTKACTLSVGWGGRMHRRVSLLVSQSICSVLSLPSPPPPLPELNQSTRVRSVHPPTHPPTHLPSGGGGHEEEGLGHHGSLSRGEGSSCCNGGGD